MQISVETPPLDSDLTEELIDFWDGIFGDGYQADLSVYAGDERSFNRDTFYLLEQGGCTVGSSHLTMAVGNPELSGLGEVATAPQCRGKGIASRLCRAARDDFLAAEGQALFLGTVNPVAARIYHRLGWRKMPGSTVWALIASGESPESFLVDYFRASDEVGIEPGSPAQRVPMIPLIVAPHDWWVLDANAELYSTRYIEQNSLYGAVPALCPSWLNKALALGLPSAPEMGDWWAWLARGLTEKVLVRWMVLSTVVTEGFGPI